MLYAFFMSKIARNTPESRVTLARLKELLEYDPETGVFRWRISRSHLKAGSVAGSLGNKGYRVILLDRVKYSEHKLAWMYVNDYYPEFEIDHKDKDKSNNKILNLRKATRSQNCSHKEFKSSETGRKRGAYPYKFKSGVRWRSCISFEGKKIHLGMFPTEDEAHAAYVSAAISYFGEFACFD